jgi:hypothetical protein
MSRALALLVPLLLLGCAAPPAEEAAQEPGGGGAGGGGETACVDHAAAGCGAMEECAWDESCGTSERTCPAGDRCCSLRLSCAPHRGDAPGGAPCVEDGDCGTGLCLDLRAGVKLCLRACDPTTGNGCVEGQHCALVELGGGATTTTCMGGTPAEPELPRWICRHDGECVDGRICRMHRATDLTGTLAIGTCEPRPEGITPDAGRTCAALPEGFDPTDETQAWTFSAQCEERGLCLPSCNVEVAAACRCQAPALRAGTCEAFRCALPCARTADCPARQTCQATEWTPEGRGDEALEIVKVCQLPRSESEAWGCWDELDCCHGGLQKDGRACCVDATLCVEQPLIDSHCSIKDDSLATGRALTGCLREDPTKVQLGARCGADADCQSGVCVPDGFGEKLCSSPCEAARDHCARIVPGTSCLPSSLENGLCLDACRFEAAGERACVP